MIKEFNYTFEELLLKPEEIEKFIGFEGGASPKPFPELIKSGISMASDMCVLKGGLKILNSVIVDKTNSTVKTEDIIFNPGKIVTARLLQSTQAALFVCSAGEEITSYSKKYSNEGDTLLGYILDSIGSLIVEKATDKMQEWLKNEMVAQGSNISDRFSPGYCNWDVSEQQKLFSLLPPDFCGITLSPSSLMNPIKSVSGIIGIGDKLKQKGYHCDWCKDSNCIYRKINRQKNI